MCPPRVKILATVGPSSSSFDTIRKLVIEGVSGFRINFSHGDPDQWTEWIKIIREVSSELEKPVSIIGDLPGPQVRIGELPVQELHARQQIKLVYSNKSEAAGVIPIPIAKFFETLDLGDTILIDDGKIILRIVEVGEHEAIALVLNDAVLYPRKTVVIFGKEVDLPAITERDVELIKYSVKHNLSYLAISFVRSSKDIVIVKDLLNHLGARINVISKIETRSAVRNLRDIISESDAVLIARGDLGMHYSLEELPSLQRRISREAIQSGKPSIVATQLLETMVNYPRPSRSEVVDVMNAVYDLIDALLLTDETAIGKYPVETVRWLKRIIGSVDSRIIHSRITETREKIRPVSLKDKYSLGLTLLAEKIDAKILLYTKTATTPPLISRYRPQIPVYVGTTDRWTAEKFTIYYGITPYYIETQGQQLDYEQGVRTLYNILKNKGEITYGEIVAEAYGRREAEIHEIKIRQVL